MKNKRKIIGGGVFLALFLISFVMQMLIDNEEILYDASLYWEYGKVFWYFANIFYDEQVPYREYNECMHGVKAELEVAKKYCEFCEMVK